ncbi:HAD-IC family P-type ATPase [Actinoplanes sp. NPDC051851]|uniref:HAD-IC family P-type ATPase n=1 Tax=Actinoplanes sp. NPDC051851 TaxID=3154753 RepID=UPI00341A5216
MTIFSLPEVRWATAATALFGLGLAVQLGGGPAGVWWACYLACYAAGGWEPGLAGLRELRARRLDVDLLMVTAAIGAAAIGQVLEGALLIVIFATSGALEALATRRTEDSVRRLLDLAPERASRLITPTPSPPAPPSAAPSPAAPPSAGTEPAGTEPVGAEPVGAEPVGAEPASATAASATAASATATGAEATGAEPSGAEPSGAEPSGAEPSGAEPSGAEAAGEELVDAVDLRVGDVIAVRPGERIGGDGHVVAGRSEVDQASITGEPLPVDKQPGDEVFAGTVNGTGSLRVRIARPAAESVVARIVAMVAEASATKAKTQLFIERVEQRYSIAMVAGTVALFTIPLLLGAALEPTLLRAMTFMIVASPCAIVLATMPPLLSAIATAGRNGVLVKSTVVMERLATVTRVAFDKTGTLSQGQPRLVSVRKLSGLDLNEPEIVALAASAEAPSEHPLARAVVAAAVSPLLPAQSFASLPGQGITAIVEGRVIEIGNPHRLLARRRIHPDSAPTLTFSSLPPSPSISLSLSPSPSSSPSVSAQASPSAVEAAEVATKTVAEAATKPAIGAAVEVATKAVAEAAIGAVAEVAIGAVAEVVAGLERRGETAVLVVIDGVPAAVLGFTDRIRTGAAPAVGALHTLTGAAPMLLTGDNPTAAGRIAADLGITEVHAGLLPEEKVSHVRRQAAAGHHVLLVGDGVNDAPALAAAHTGIAMGRSGADLTVATADAVLVGDDLTAIPAVIALSRRARRLVIANLITAAAFIAVLVTWDLAGNLPLPLGVAGHEGSTVIVGLNGLRLLRDAAWRNGRP